MAAVLERMMDRLLIKGLFLFCSQALFLWMFFSTSTLERMADAKVLQGVPDRDVRELVYKYAAEWRHGLAGFWPVYVPGFFAAAIAAWVWALGRPLRKLLPELLAVTAAAMVFAFVLAPEGTRLVLRDLHLELGVTVASAAPAVDAHSVTLGVYSLLAWNGFTLACHRALWWRSLWPLIVPIAMDLVLIFIRPYTFDDLVSTWIQRASHGNLRAIICLLAVPVAAAWLAAIQLRHERRGLTGRTPRRRTSCLLFGHKADNRELAASTGQPVCRCGAAYLALDGGCTRVGHTLRCFVGGHHYRFAGARDMHHEYVCMRCGHPLLLECRGDGQPRDGIFRKAVHYPCGVLGHRVHEVSRRAGGVEYACFCGHSFLRQEGGERKIRHPLICVLLGHFVHYAGRRFGFAEFVAGTAGIRFRFVCKYWNRIALARFRTLASPCPQTDPLHVHSVFRYSSSSFFSLALNAVP